MTLEHDYQDRFAGDVEVSIEPLGLIAVKPVELDEDEPSEYRVNLQHIVDDYSEHYIIELDSEEVEALANSDGLNQLSITNVYNDPPDFAKAMGYKNYKPYILNSIVMDALLSYELGNEVRYSRDGNSYSGCSHLGHTSTVKAINFLSDEGYIIDFRVPANSHMPLQSFFKPTEALYDDFGHLTDTVQTSLKPYEWCIETTLKEQARDYILGLKYIPKVRVKAKEEYFSPLNDDVVEQNRFLAQYQYDFHSPKELCRVGNIISYISSKGTRRITNLSKIYQKRVFIKDRSNDAPHLGGRFYGGFWQGMSKGDRALITIDGERVGKELDYSELHPSLAYILKGLEKPASAYDCSCELSLVYDDDSKWRQVCKMALIYTMNATSISDAAGALVDTLIDLFPNLYPPFKTKDEMRQKPYRDAKKVIKAMIRHNEAIADYMCAGYGIKFQKVDSYIMAAVQRRCRDSGIPILGVHDSILFPESKTEEVKHIFYDEFDFAKNNLIREGLGFYDI